MFVSSIQISTSGKAQAKELFFTIEFTALHQYCLHANTSWYIGIKHVKKIKYLHAYLSSRQSPTILTPYVTIRCIWSTYSSLNIQVSEQKYLPLASQMHILAAQRIAASHILVEIHYCMVYFDFDDMCKKTDGSDWIFAGNFGWFPCEVPTTQDT